MEKTRRRTAHEPREVEIFPFSFITKLAATVSSDYPIYDSLVADVLGFDERNRTGNWEARRERCLAFYKWLQTLYDTLLSRTVTPSAIAALNSHYSGALPDMKALDFLFWQAGKLEIVAAP